MADKVPNAWTLQDAKNRFSEVVRAALDSGPQTVTRHGAPAVVIVAAADYDRQPAVSLFDALRPPGFMGVDLDITRDRSPMRHVDLPDL